MSKRDRPRSAGSNGNGSPVSTTPTVGESLAPEVPPSVGAEIGTAETEVPTAPTAPTAIASSNIWSTAGGLDWDAAFPLALKLAGPTPVASEAACPVPALVAKEPSDLEVDLGRELAAARASEVALQERLSRLEAEFASAKAETAAAKAEAASLAATLDSERAAFAQLRNATIWEITGDNNVKLMILASTIEEAIAKARHQHPSVRITATRTAGIQVLI